MISYKDYLLLAFSHFDKNETAYIDVGEYETLLFRMWSELRNVYMGKSISIPLLGGGVTTIKGKSEKNYTELLRCMLCTLRNSQFQPTQGITIVLTKSVMDKIDIVVYNENQFDESAKFSLRKHQSMLAFHIF